MGLDHARRHPPRPVGGDAARPPRLIGRVRGVLGVELFLQAPARLKKPIGTVLGDRAALALALGFQRAAALAHPRAPTLRAGDELPRIELDRRRLLVVRRRLAGVVALAGQALLGLAQRLAAALARAQMLGQLVAALAAVKLVLAPIRLGRLGEDLPRDPAEVAVGVHRRVGRDLRAIDRHHADRHQPRPRAQPQHAREHIGQRPLMPATELRDRRVIRARGCP